MKINYFISQFIERNHNLVFVLEIKNGIGSEIGFLQCIFQVTWFLTFYEISGTLKYQLTLPQYQFNESLFRDKD